MNVSLTIGGGNPAFVGLGVTFTATFFLKGPEQNTATLYATPSIGAATHYSGISVGASVTYVYGDERNFDRKSLTGKADDYSIGYKAVGLTHSRMETAKGDRIRSSGLSVGLNGTSLGKWNMPANGSASKSYTFDLKSIFSGKYKKEINESKTNENTPKENAKDYYIRRYTNLPTK